MKYSIKVNEVTKGSENIRGIASVTLGDSFKLNNIKIMNDPREENKLFVAMPSYKNNEGEYKDIFNPNTKEFRNELYDNILQAYHELHDVQAKNSYTVEYNKRDTKMPDFNVRVTPYEREGSTIKGLASISFDGITVNNVSIQQGAEKTFVSMPSYKTNQTDERGKAVYKDMCHPVTAKFHDKLYGAILQEYDNALEQAKAKDNAKDSVLGKLDENKKTVKKVEKDSKAQEKSAKEHEQHKRDDVQR